MAGKTRFGRPVLAATIRADTKFDVTKKAVQVNLHSTDAAGTPIYARYNMPLGSEAAANEFAALAKGCAPQS